MAFPHPKSRQDKYRNEDKPSSGGVVWNLFKRTINITEYRNGKDDVNPAKNRTFGGFFHFYLSSFYSLLLSRLRRPVGCFDTELLAVLRIQPLPAAELHGSAPTMRPIGSPARSRSRTSKQMCQPAAPHEMKRRSLLCHSVRRVRDPKASSSQRISPHSSTLGASARVTLVSSGVGVPTQ